MNSLSASEDLSFLDDAFPQFHLFKPERYRRARWLKCDFDAVVWRCEFGDGSLLEIDWRVSIGSSGLLTDARHSSLWLTLRCWLILSTHPDSTGGRLLNSDTERRKVNLCCDLIDYFLVHADEIGLPDHGLKAMTRDDVIAALCRIGSTSRVSIGIYEWPTKVELYLRRHSEELSPSDVDAIVRQYPFVALEIPEPADRLTSFTDEEIVRVRAWLWSKGLYRNGAKGDQYQRIVPSRRLAALVYGCVIKKDCRHPALSEIGLLPRESALREFPSAPVRENDDIRMSRERLNEYIRSMGSMGVLHAVGLPVPIDAIRAINDLHASSSLDLKRNGRFRTLPASVVFGALRSAIEFALKYGADLVTSYLALAAAAKRANMSVAAYASCNSISDFLTPSLAEMGICQWRIGRGHGALQGKRDGIANRDYYDSFRANKGLWEIIRVFYGSVQITVGTLMARRVRELMKLRAGHCLDKSSKYLIFDLGKSGTADQREAAAKRIPPVAVRFIREIERLQDGLIKIGMIGEQTNLFSYPCGTGNSALSDSYLVYFSHTNDYFCDYFQLPLDNEGRRYYIRQHQLRRFFAMLFFWSNSFGGLETLRDFMGHTDAEHVYRYITESTPGTLLRSVQAEWAAEAVKTQWAAANDLADLVATRFDTRNFRVLRDDELVEYIEDLLEEGLVTIEPEFLDSGKRYRILIKVSSMEFST